MMSEHISQIRGSVMDAIGNTPVVMLSRLFRNAEVVAKLEFMNPGGSIKDRMVRHMLRHSPVNVKHVVESSSGNTGAALAMASAIYGLQCDITVPDRTSVEKVKRIQAYGAEVHVCVADVPESHERSYHSVAERIAADTGAFHLDQYRSEMNRQAHYADTAPELWFQLNCELDYFVCGIGSGGTISGIGRYLKDQNPNIKVIGVEPANSAYRKLVTNDECGDEYRTVMEGVGKRTPSASFDPSVVDDVIQVTDEEALEYCRRLAREEGILAGGSSGCVAAGIAKALPKLHGRIATIFPDSGAFYLSKYF
jgi:cystathionine beta-synthase